MRIAKLIVFLCVLVLIIVGIYSFLVGDMFSGIIWTVLGIFIFIVALVRMR